MAASPEQQAEAERIAAELATVGFVLPGTLTERMTRCGRPNCRCHGDPPALHGPYHQWTRAVHAKTATQLFSGEQAAEYGPWFNNERRLRTLVHDLEALGLAIVESDPRTPRR
jgi:hypothetical protein